MEQQLEFEDEIKEITAEIERMVPNVRASEKYLYFTLE
jgi:hypothetical protein